MTVLRLTIIVGIVVISFAVAIGINLYWKEVNGNLFYFDTVCFSFNLLDNL